MYKCWEMLPRIEAVCQSMDCEECFMNGHCPMGGLDSVYYLTEEQLKEFDIRFVELEQKEGRFPLLISEIAATEEEADQIPKCEKKKRRQFYLTRDNIPELNKLFDAGWHISDEVHDNIDGKEVRNLVLVEN